MQITARLCFLNARAARSTYFPQCGGAGCVIVSSGPSWTKKNLQPMSEIACNFVLQQRPEHSGCQQPEEREMAVNTPGRLSVSAVIIAQPGETPRGAASPGNSHCGAEQPAAASVCRRRGRPARDELHQQADKTHTLSVIMTASCSRTIAAHEEEELILWIKFCAQIWSSYARPEASNSKWMQAAHPLSLLPPSWANYTPASRWLMHHVANEISHTVV